MTRLESDYYRHMGYDPANTRSVLSHYVGYFADGAADGPPVLELGSGRGEFLDLLREAGVRASGVDSDEGMVDQARSRGLDVVLGDALATLEGTPPGSLGGVVAAHLMEHLAVATAARLLAAAKRALAPGGTLVVVVPSAACLSVLQRDFWRDPTHVRFYDPDLVAFLCAHAGLDPVEVAGNPRNHPGAPPGTLAAEPTVDPDFGEALNDAVRALLDPKGKGKVDMSSPWWSIAHVIARLDERLRRTQEELFGLRRAHHSLLAALYPPNEVYVVARA